MLRNTLLFIQLGLFLPTLAAFIPEPGRRHKSALQERVYCEPHCSALRAVQLGRGLEAAALIGLARSLSLHSWQGLLSGRFLPGPLGFCPVAVTTEPLAPGLASTFSDSPVGEFFFFLMTPGGYLYHWFSSGPEDAHTSDPLSEESAVPSESPLCICSPGLL